MANTLLTPSIIAQESLMILQNNLVMGNLVNHDYSSEFTGKQGDTITVRKRANFTVDEFDGTITVQNAVETGIPVKMDKLLDISFEISSQDLAMNITDFAAQFIEPAMSAFAQDIDARLAELANEIPFYAGTAGTTPSTVASITGVRKVLNDNKAPLPGRKLVVDTTADASLLGLDAFQKEDAYGYGAINEAVIGRKFGFDVFFDQNILQHENGDLTGTAIKVTAKTDPGATELTLSDTSLTGTMTRGTLFTVAGSTQQFVCLEDAEASGNSVTVKISPAVSEEIAASSAVTIVDDHAKNIAFHKNAFALVSRPLARPMGNSNVATISSNGIGLRVNMSYDPRAKSDIVSLDGLFGFAVLDPALACVLLG